ncbi:hypothetical protein HDZ31DRAFT_81253 [Schizophyllum fasciatum]
MHSMAFAASRGSLTHATNCQSTTSSSVRSLASRPIISGSRRIALTWPLPVPPASCFTTSAKAEHRHHHHCGRDPKSEDPHPHWSHWHSRWGGRGFWGAPWWERSADMAGRAGYGHPMYSRGCPMWPRHWGAWGMPEGAGAAPSAGAGAQKAGYPSSAEADPSGKDAHMEMRGGRWGGRWGHKMRGKDFEGYGSSRWLYRHGKRFGRHRPPFLPLLFLSIPFMFCVPFFFPAAIFLLAAPFMFIMSIPILMLHFFLDLLFWIF